MKRFPPKGRCAVFGAFLGVFLCVGAPVFAEQDEDRVRYLIELSGGADIGVMIFENMMMSFRDTFPDVPAEFWDRMVDVVETDDIMDILVPIYRKHFTAEDIAGLIRFYESPLGRKLIERQPDMAQESMSAGETWGERIAQEVVDRMIADGYIGGEGWVEDE